MIIMPEKPANIPSKNSCALQEKALDLIGSSANGVYQSELRRLLAIDSSKCSRIVVKLQGSGLIRREKVPASSTYLIRLVQPKRDISWICPKNSHIDSYLTELYLLYLLRGISA
jgi:DNA-binding Lrp family transcriptional regulator